MPEMIELAPERRAKLRELFEAFMERHGIEDEQEAVALMARLANKDLN